MGDKKRKAAASDTANERPAKKPQTNKVKVIHLKSPDVAKPVVAFSPGFTLPADLQFKAFSKSPSATQPASSLLLQSSEHPTIDYVAAESQTTEAREKHMKHYIAVFDPTSNKLKVVEAKKVTVRSSVRQVDQARESDDETTTRTTTSTPMASSRAALTEAFGTKKSKKAVASVAENRLLARSGENAADNPVSNAILSTIKDEDDPSLDTNPQSSASLSRVNKPLPQANLDTTDIEEVYPLSSLVFPGPAQTTLSQMPLGQWRERIGSKKDVVSRYRFIAHRVERLTRLHLDNPDDQTALVKLQLLRYIQLLLELYTYITRLPGRKPIPQPEKWPANTVSETSLSTAFLSKLVAHFAPTGIPTQHAKTLLTTTILALTLHIPPPKWQPGATMTVLITEPSDISLDLASQPAEVSKLYRELGCKMESLNDTELARWGWEKTGKARKVVDEDGNETTLPKPKFAKLRFPVEFPKISAGRPGRR